VQRIFFAASDDLLRWRRLQTELGQDDRWYEPKGRWDTINTLPRAGGGLLGYWTASPRGRAGFAIGQSDDGLRWSAAAPPQLDWRNHKPARECELGDVDKIGERYYAMLGVGGTMRTFVADAPDGPFAAATRNFVLLQGHGYFTRFVRSPEALLVVHHSISHQRHLRKMLNYTAPLKRAVVDGQGTLRLMWWAGNEKLKGEAIPVPAPTGAEAGKPAILPARFDAARGFIVEGTFKRPPGNEPVGLILEAEDDWAGAFLIDSDGACRAGHLKSDGSGFAPAFRVQRDRGFADTVRFRLLVRHTMAELYLDDELFHVLSLPLWSTGRIGLLGSNPHVEGWEAWTMTLDPEPRVPRERGRAWRKPARASSGIASLAVDGNPATEWQSQPLKSSGQHEWIEVDLGTERPLSEVSINWGSRFARDYAVQVSADATTWQTVHRAQEARGGVETLSTPAHRCRHLRIDCGRPSRPGEAVAIRELFVQ
jgi:hypothetical protein